MKTVCAKHEQAYEVGEGCPWCEPEPSPLLALIPESLGGSKREMRIVTSDAVPVGQAYAIASVPGGRHALTVSDDLRFVTGPQLVMGSTAVDIEHVLLLLHNGFINHEQARELLENDR